MSGILFITNPEMDDVDGYDQYFYPETDSYSVTVSSIECDDHSRLFISLTAIDFYNEGSSWSVWASEWMSDDTIMEIYELVNSWQDEWADSMADADIKTKVLAKYETYLDIMTSG